MKQLIALCVLLPGLALAGGEMKKVCHQETKNGKQVEVCKTIKVHKKLEGKTVPGQKP